MFVAFANSDRPLTFPLTCRPGDVRAGALIAGILRHAASTFQPRSRDDEAVSKWVGRSGPGQLSIGDLNDAMT